MKCEELLAALNEYVDGTVDPALCREFEQHLAGCHACRLVVDNLRKSVTLYRDGKPCDLPAPIRERLHAALRHRWKQTHADTSVPCRAIPAA
jgi:anti-sigma factor RsiW